MLNQASKIPQDETAVKELREYIRSQGEGDLDIPSLCHDIQNQFSPDFFERLGRELLHQTVYRVVVVEFQPSRAITKIQARINREYADWESDKGRSIFAEWRESVEPGRKVALLDLDRQDNKQVLANWRDREAEAGTHVAFHTSLGRRLKGDLRVRDVWTITELAGLCQKHGIVDYETE